MGLAMQRAAPRMPTGLEQAHRGPGPSGLPAGPGVVELPRREASPA